MLKDLKTMDITEDNLGNFIKERMENECVK